MSWTRVHSATARLTAMVAVARGPVTPGSLPVGGASRPSASGRVAEFGDGLLDSGDGRLVATHAATHGPEDHKIGRAHV